MKRALGVGVLILTGIFGTGCVTPPFPPRVTSQQAEASRKVNTGPFWWGISSSAFQNEDRAEKEGSPNYFRTDWDIFADAGRVPKKEDRPFSWTSFDKDVEALKRIGINHYRFGVEWARVEPQKGRYNEAAIRKYVEMARKLKANGIEPVVTLWHFTFPDWLMTTHQPKRSRWLHPDFQDRWAAYVDKMTKAFGNDVRVYVPQNEPNGDLALGYISSVWPPGMFLAFGTHDAALKQSTKAFRKAAEIIKQNRKDALVMGVHALPAWLWTFWDPTAAYYNFMQRINFAHLDRVADVCDLIGFNYYYTEYADFSVLVALKMRKGKNYSLLGWLTAPDSLYSQIRTVSKRYKKPIVITENGIATGKDAKRVKYLFNHIFAVREAINDGYDVRGYFIWTLVDNYEWHHGYKAPFGISKMDERTHTRLLRPSALFYHGIIDLSKNAQTMDELSLPDGLPKNYRE